MFYILRACHSWDRALPRFTPSYLAPFRNRRPCLRQDLNFQQGRNILASPSSASPRGHRKAPLRTMSTSCSVSNPIAGARRTSMASLATVRAGPTPTMLLRAHFRSCARALCRSEGSRPQNARRSTSHIDVLGRHRVEVLPVSIHGQVARFPVAVAVRARQLAVVATGVLPHPAPLDRALFLLAPCFRALPCHLLLARRSAEAFRHAGRAQLGGNWARTCSARRWAASSASRCSLSSSSASRCISAYRSSEMMMPHPLPRSALPRRAREPARRRLV